MKKQILFSLILFLSGFNFLIAQPKITFNTDQNKTIRVRAGETLRIELKVGNFGDEAIDDNYEILAGFNTVEGFINNSRYRLSSTQMQGVSLGINEQKTVVFEYEIPEDAPKVEQTLIFSAQGKQALQSGGGYLFLRIKIENRIPLPDLVARNILYPGNEPFYQELNVKFEIANVGELLAFDPSKTQLYLSRNRKIDENSILLDEFEVPAMVVNDKITIDKNYSFEDIPPAVYQLIILVDSEAEVKENNEFNNLFIVGFRIPINEGTFPDLFFSRIQTPAAITIGDPTANDEIVVSIQNQTIPFGESIPIEVPFCNHLYLSEDTQLDETDRLLGTASITTAIPTGSTRSLYFNPSNCYETPSNTTLFPSDISAGRYYLIFLLDAEEDIIEFNEGNTNFRRIELVAPNVEARTTTKAFAVFPNPTQDLVTVSFEVKQNISSISYQLYNAQGQIILTDQCSVALGINQLQLNMNTFAEGTYFLKIGEDIKRIVKQF